MMTTMWNNIRKPLFALSLGLNLAFIAMWLVHLPSGPSGNHGISRTVVSSAAVPSTLHREIGVTQEQWKTIAPLVQDFRENAGKQRRKISALRSQLMDLLTMPAVDNAAIGLKQEEIQSNQRQMQNMVIEHLLKEREILSPEQTKKMMQYIREQCRQDSGIGSRKGIGRVLEEKSGVVLDEEQMKSK